MRAMRRGAGRFCAAADTPARPDATRAAHVSACGGTGAAFAAVDEDVELDCGKEGGAGDDGLSRFFSMVTGGGDGTAGISDAGGGCAVFFGGELGGVVLDVRARSGGGAAVCGDDGGDVVGDASCRSHCSTVSEPNCMLIATDGRRKRKKHSPCLMDTI